MVGCNECGTTRRIAELHAQDEGIALDDVWCCEDTLPPECEGCHLPRATYWWAVTGCHQCAECHAQGERDILAREAAEADESEPECTDDGCPEHGMNPRLNPDAKVAIGRVDWGFADNSWQAQALRFYR